MLLEPVGSHHSQDTLRGTQRFPHQVDPVEPTDPGEYMGGVRALSSSSRQPPVPLARFQQDLQQPLFGVVLYQPGTKLGCAPKNRSRDP